MSFSSENGYLPSSFDQLMSFVRESVNEKFLTSYTVESFVGTNWYKYFYSVVQRLSENEIKMSEIFLRLQEYFETTNEKLQRSLTTAPGIVDFFKSKGYLVSVKPPADADAGKIYICVDVNDSAPDYADTKLALCTLVKQCVGAGIISQGTEVESLTLSNSQSFDFKYNLPDPVPVLLRLTIVQSENNLYPIETTEWIKERLLANIEAKYRLGMNFEPQRYFSIVDAPWAETILLEWSDDDGGTWNDEVFESEYNEVFTFDPEDDVEIVES